MTIRERLPQWFGWLIVIIFTTSSVRAEENKSSELSPNGRDFRRIYVPVDRPQEWPTDGERYLPIDKAEFAQLLDDASTAAQATPGMMAARVVAADHTARVENEDLLTGQAVLEISHHAAQPALLPLTPWSAAVTAARWEATEKDKEQGDDATPAVLGNTSDGTLAVLVQRSGRLIIDWTLRGHRNLSGTVGFTMNLPQIPSSTLILDAPANFVPEMDRALVVRIDSGSSDTGRWKIASGGRPNGLLRLTTGETRGQRRELTLLRQFDTYEISTRGIDLVSTLRIDAHGDPLSHILLQCDPNLQIISARKGKRILAWTVAVDPKTERSQVRIDLPEAIAGAGEAIQLTAIAPLTTRELHRLPRFRCEGMFWQEGNATLIVRSPLALNRLETSAARQTKSAVLAGTQTGESFEVQCFSPDAAIDIAVDRPENQVAVDSGTRIEFFSGEMVAHVVADFRVPQRDQSVLSCQVNPLWQIDSVEAGGPVPVSDWDVEGADPHRILVVRLARSVTPTRPARLKITGRRVLSLNEAMSVRELTVLNLLDMEQSPSRMLLLDPDAFDLQISGSEELTRLNGKSLKADDPMYSEATPRGLGFVLDGAAERMRITLRSRKPQFSAKLRVESEVRGTNLVERCQIRCRPSGATMDHLLVHLSEDRPDASWQWSARKELGPLVTRKLNPDEQLAAGAGSTGQAWEVSWRVPQRELIELNAECSSPWTARSAVTLISVPEAASQTGQVEVRALEGTGVEIVNRRLVTVPAVQESAESFPTVRGAFRYDPTRDGLGDDAALELSPTQSAREQSGAWVWNCQLDTRMSTNGVTSHLAVFKLQTAGQQTIRFTLPPGAVLREAWTDTLPILTSEYGSSPSTVTVRLQSNREYASVTLYFATSESLPRLTESYTPPFPSADVPVLARRWRVWLPNGYRLPTNDIHAHAYSQERISWSQRLFGVLGRGDYAASRNPLNPDFWIPSASSSRAARRAESQVEPVLKMLGSDAVLSSDVQRPPTWGDALMKITTDFSGFDVRISQSSLADVGIDFDSPLPAVVGDTPVLRGASMLRQANLALLVRDQRVLLVSSTFAALNHRVITPVAKLPLYVVGESLLADDLMADSTKSQPLDFVSAAGWQTVSRAQRPPWSLPEIAVNNLAEARGWRAYQFDLSDATALRVSIQNTSAIYSIATGLVLAAFATGLWHSHARRRWWVLVLSAAFCVALVAPIQWSPLAAAVFLGSLSSGIWTARRQPKAADEDQSTSLASTAFHRLQVPVSTVILLISSSWFATTAWSQEAVTPDTQKNSAKGIPASPGVARLRKLLVPIDDSGKEAGEKYYVPDSLYRLLLQDAAQVQAIPKGWILTSARYRTALNREAAAEQEGSLQLRASFNVYVFNRDTLIRIPVSGEGARVIRESIYVDGRPASTVESTSGEVAVRISEPGSRQVEFTLVPGLQVIGAVAGFDIDVPAVSRAQMELSGADPSLIELPAAKGKIESDKEHGRVIADLGGSRRLTARWPQATQTDGAVAAFEIDELQWAKVQPGSMGIDVRLNVRVLEGRVRQFRLLADPRLQLISPTGGDSAILVAREVAGDPQVIDIELARPITNQGVVRLKFDVAGASGVGNLRMPRCEVSGVRASRRWFAVSVDPSLEFKQEIGEDVPAVPIPDFAAAWNEGAARPQAAFRLSRGEVSWILSTQPKAAASTTTETLVLSVEPRSTKFLWQADVSTTVGYVIQRHVHVAPEVRIDDVKVFDSSQKNCLSRWSRKSQDGSLTLLLNGPVTGDHRIVIRGNLAHDLKSIVAAPQLMLNAAQTTLRRLVVLRRPQVLATVRTTGEWLPQASVPAGVDIKDLGSLVQVLTTTDKSSLADIDISPNQPRSEASQLLTISHDGEDWTAELDFRLRVRAGVADTLLFDIPLDWENPVLVEPIPAGASATVVETDGLESRRLVIRPANPVSDEARFVLRGIARSSESERFRVPNITPLGMRKLTQFVLLPKQMDLEPIAWDTTGLSLAKIPLALVNDQVVLQSHTAHQATKNDFLATLRVINQDANRPGVALSETQLIWQWDGGGYGTTTFAVVPAGLTHCVLKMPAGFEAIHCRVSGIPTSLTSLGEDRWRVPLLAHPAPQTVQLVFRASANAIAVTKSEVQLVGPGMDGLDIACGLWKVWGPSQCRSGSLANARWQASIARYQSERLQIATDLDRLEHQAVGSESDDDSPSIGVVADIKSSALANLEIARTSQQDTSAAFANEESVQKELKPSAIILGGSGERATIEEALSFTHQQRRPTLCMTRSDSSEMGPITVILDSMRFGDAVWRWMLAIAVLALSILFVRASDEPLPAASAPILGIVVGAVWWIWLAPTCIAAALLLASASAIIRGWSPATLAHRPSE